MSSRLPEILSIVQEMNANEYDDSNYEIEVSMDNLFEEIKKASEKWRHQNKVIDKIIDQLTELSSGNYHDDFEIESSGDDGKLDVIVLALNMLREELKNTTVSKNVLDDIFSSLGSPFLIIDNEDRVITQYNSSALEFFEYDKTNTYNIPIETFFGKKLSDQLLKFSELETKNLEYTFNFKGKKKHTLISVQQLSSSFSSRSSISVIITDITDSFEKEKLKNDKILSERSLKFKSDFLATMSHEIRTPLNGIIGIVDSLSRNNYDEKTNKSISIINSSSKTLLNILNDILDLSKIEAGKIRIHKDDCNLNDLCESVIHLFMKTAKSKGVSMSFEPLDPEVCNVKIDENRVKQILSNYISNAVKFTNKGYIKVIPKIKENNLLHFEVVDTGKGISRQERESLFTPFEQLENQTNKVIKGTGLGLSICKQLSEILGGEAGCVSEVGEGSTFWFTCKYEKIDEKEGNEVIDVKNGEIKQFDANILLVEDLETNQEIGKVLISHYGCKVDVAKDGIQCLQIIEENKDAYDLIFMDVRMPIMDGVETTRKLKRKYKNLPPIVGLSAEAASDSTEKYIGLGMDDYTSKPISIDSLAVIFNKWINDTEVNRKKTIKIEEPQLEKNEQIKFYLDHTYLENLKGLVGADKFLPIVKKFIDNVDEINSKIKFGLEQKNYELIKEELHKLKGVSKSMNAVPLNSKVVECESLLEDPEKIEMAIKEMADLATNSIKEIKHLYKNA